MDRTLAKAFRAKTGRSRQIATAVSLAVLFSTILLVAPAGATKPARPDLIVTSAKFTGYPYYFWKEPQKARSSFTDTTKNTGSATADDSQTALFLAASRNPCSLNGELAGIRNVPTLKRGQASSGSFQSKASLTFHQLGTYYVAAHADFNRQVDYKSGGQGNNCKPTGQHVDVIPRRFVGTVTGSSSWAGLGLIKDTWTATVSFMAAGANPKTPGVYIYTLEEVNMSYQTRGIDGDCTWIGDFHARFLGKAGGQVRLTLDYNSNTYQLFGALPIFPAYFVSIVCPNGSSQLPGPNGAALIWLSSDVSSDQKKWPSIDGHRGERTGTLYRTLDDSYDCTIPSCDTKWIWRLAAKT